MVLLENKKTKGMKSHLANLVAIAKLDGEFSLAEKRLIFDIGTKNGLSQEKIKKIIRSEKPIEFKVPKNDSDRFDRVYDLIQMAYADGVCTEDEIASCIELAEKLGFKKAITGVLVRKIAMELGAEEPKTKEEIKTACGDFLSYEQAA